jgi:hypothetical protein
MNGQNYFLEETDFISYLFDQGFRHILELIVMDLPLKDIINKKRLLTVRKLNFIRKHYLFRKKLYRNFNQMSCHYAIALEKLIALFVDRSRPIKQANPKVLDYISQTMVYYPNLQIFT